MPYTRTVLVTNATSGVGYELSLLLAKNGETVYIGARDKMKGKEAQSKLRREHELDVQVVQMDIADLKSVEAARRTIEKAEGKLDVLVNNPSDEPNTVAHMKDRPSFQPFDIDRSVVRQAFDLNLYGMIQTTTTFLPLIRKARKGYGSIQFVFTYIPTNGRKDASPNTSTAELRAYVISLSKKLQAEETGITVNAVTPGLARTASNTFAPDESTSEESARVLLPYAQLGPEDAHTTGKFFDARGEYFW